MTERFLVFQHTSWEKPGRYLVDLARKRRMRLDIVEVWHEPIPDIGSYDGLIVLGGTPNVDQEETYTFLKAEAASPADVREWMEGDREWLSQIGIDGTTIIRGAIEQETLIGAQFEAILDNYFKLIS